MMPKLLLADDSITVQRVIALTFQGEGIEVIAVGDGDLAVDAIDRERPQIVLADLSMPGRDGYAVAEYVKRSPELSKDIRVVLLTGAAEPVEEARSRALGIDGVLSKPFEPHVATALVRRLLTERPTVPGFREAESGGGGVSDAPAAAVTSTADNAIAVDDYFRRLDEALATAGLSTAPEPAGDLASIAFPGLDVDHAGDAETMIVPRPAPVAGAAQPAQPAKPVQPVQPVEADEPGEASNLVDAFSALLAAEEGDGNPMVAGPVEMEGAPAPSPAVEWTPRQTAVAPVEDAAETVAFQAVAAEVVETRAWPAAVEFTAEATAPGTPATAEASPAEAPAEAESSAPSALRADAPEPATLEGIDLDVLADAVAQKILHRLTDARIDAIVSERVLEIAERLVREEIDRIKADAQ
jgi:CheY-like chemotaxis protein